MTFDLKRFDIYRKIPKDLTQPTTTGAIVSICCTVFITLLIIIELISFISPEIRSVLEVDNGDQAERISVRINASIPGMKCEYLGIDIQDDMGRHEVGFIDNTAKTPIGPNSEGCMIEALFKINRVPGNFHISTHSVETQPVEYNFEHTIHELSFGSRIKFLSAKNVGVYNALAGTSKDHNGEAATYEYIMKIVPTSYTDVRGTTLHAFQYTYAYRSHTADTHRGRMVPAIWFRYDLNPISIRYHESRPPIYHFLTTICAIVGGTFTVAGIIDSCIFSASEIIRKFELGKLN